MDAAEKTTLTASDQRKTFSLSLCKNYTRRFLTKNPDALNSEAQSKGQVKRSINILYATDAGLTGLSLT